MLAPGRRRPHSAENPARSATITASEPIEVESYYRYGYEGREMAAIRAPFAMSSESAFIGRIVRIGACAHVVRAVARQISGPIEKGEPLGIELG